jgi:hypothetical protein
VRNEELKNDPGFRENARKAREEMESMLRLERAEWQIKALKEVLTYLVATEDRKDTIGKDSIYYSRKKLGWSKARKLLSDLEISETTY